MTGPVLEIDNLSVDFPLENRTVHAVRRVSLTINRGETVALVGESGSGKSVTALSVLRLLPEGSRFPTGAIRHAGQDLLRLPVDELRKIRGRSISMIFQEPMTSLNPLHTIGRQVAEALILHRGLRPQAARARAIELLNEVGLPEPEKRLDDYPHQFSGGQRQRVMIAMALANEPDLLIADEPTTALDVTVEAQILALLKSLQQKRGMAMLFITHDLGIVRALADHTHVMKEGEIVESGETAALFANPTHPYTKALLAAEPRFQPAQPAPDAPDLLSTEQLRVWFPIKRGLFRRTVGHVKAVDGVTLRLREGETLGVVGESGSGKTTLGRALLRLIPADGPIVWLGQRIDGTPERDMRPLRRNLQIVFQDPYGSLSPRMSVGEIIAEGLEVHARTLSPAARDDRVAAALTEVGLSPGDRHRYPHEFSGGQRQRIAIARAMVLEPRFLVLDEPTSALDVSVQAKMVDLLAELQRRHRLTYLFISHDLAVVRALATTLIVMKDGEVVEQGAAETVFSAPKSPYTRALMAAAFSPGQTAGPDQ